MIPQEILDAPIWCVSKDKVPMDMHVLPKGLEWGVSNRRSHSCYVGCEAALAESRRTGYAATMWVDASTHPICVLDIEKDCPAGLRRAMILSLHDHTLHIERSASGKGYHIMLSLPQTVSWKNAKYRKWFEILTSHHCLMSGREIPPGDAYADEFPENGTMDEDPDGPDMALLDLMSKPISVEDLYEAVSDGSQAVKPVTSEDLGAYKDAVKGFGPEHADLFNCLCDFTYEKTLDGDFSGDWSRYEYGYLSKMHYLLQRCAADMLDMHAEHFSVRLSKQDAVMLVYMAAKQMLPPRDKHATYRNGLPWLLYTSERIYVRTFEDGG